MQKDNAMTNLEELFNWYLSNQDKLVEQYNGKYLVIKDNQVVDVYDDENTAYFEASNKYGLGNFILQLCTPGKDAYTIEMYTPRFAVAR